MTTILAAVDADSARRRVLEAGAALASVFHAHLQPVHVAHPGEAAGAAHDLHTPLRIIPAGARPDGSNGVSDALVRAIEQADVVAAVIGTRTQTETGAPPGHVAVNVASRVDKPVALIPPGSPSPVPGRPLRALVPLDGSELSASTVRAVVRLVADAEVEIVVLHVFAPATTPRFLDRPEHDLPAWAEEFQARYCDEPSRIVWRRGAPGAAIVDVARAERVDAVIFGWGQELGGGHAAPVRAALTSAGVPVILVPWAASRRPLTAAR